MSSGMGSGSREAVPDRAVPPLRRIDPDLTSFQSSLEELPSEGLGQKPARVEDEVAAIGPVQRARSDHGEIGDQRAEVGVVLDAASHVRVGWKVLVNDGR